MFQVSKASVVPLSKATTASCGAKAAACAELAQLAEKNKKKDGFGTAAGVCLPFGCMEAVIQVPCLYAAFGLMHDCSCAAVSHTHTSHVARVCDRHSAPSA